MIWMWLTVFVAAIILLNRGPVSNCPLCLWAVDGQCGHPIASQVPEAAEIQTGAWRCPWRELAPRKHAVTALDALDTCECGRLPEIVAMELEGQDREEYQAACKCGRYTWWAGTVDQVVVMWNVGQRWTAEEEWRTCRSRSLAPGWERRIAGRSVQ